VNEGKIFYAHFRSPNGEGAITFAICTRVGLSGEPTERLVGWAFCAPTDQFSRRRGRTIARGRIGNATMLYNGAPDVREIDVCNGMVLRLLSERQEWDVDACGNLPPEPKVPRWFPSFVASLEVARSGKE